MDTFTLPYDVARCRDKTCRKKETCMRWLARNDLGPRTPFIEPAGYRDGCFLYLEVEVPPNGPKGE